MWLSYSFIICSISPTLPRFMYPYPFFPKHWTLCPLTYLHSANCQVQIVLATYFLVSDMSWWSMVFELGITPLKKPDPHRSGSNGNLMQSPQVAAGHYVPILRTVSVLNLYRYCTFCHNYYLCKNTIVSR